MPSTSIRYDITENYKRKIFEIVEDYIRTIDEKDTADMLIIKKNGIMEKCSNNYQNNCENGPAIIYPDGREEWRVNENLHRIDGPAMTDKKGNLYWYVHGKEYKVLEEYFEKLERMNLSEEHIAKLKTPIWRKVI